MRKYPSDVSISETCIDANLKMVERRDPDCKNGARRQNPKLPLNSSHSVLSKPMVHLTQK